GTTDEHGLHRVITGGTEWRRAVAYRLLYRQRSDLRSASRVLKRCLSQKLTANLISATGQPTASFSLASQKRSRNIASGMHTYTLTSSRHGASAEAMKLQEERELEHRNIALEPRARPTAKKRRDPGRCVLGALMLITG